MNENPIPQITVTPEFLTAQGFSQTIVARFLAKLNMSGGPDACWPWMGSIGDTGYGQIQMGLKRQPIRIHVLSYILHFGPIPEGKIVLHKCPGKHMRECGNPKHLHAGTYSENYIDVTECGNNPQRKLLGKKDEIFALRAQGWSQWKIARHFGATQAAIWYVLNGKHYKDRGEGYYTHAPVENP